MRQPNGRNFPLTYLLMGSPGLLANRPTSRREHAILVTRDGVECFEVFRGQRNADHDHGDSKMRLKFIRDRATAPVLTSDSRDSRLLGFIDPTPRWNTIVPLSHIPASLAPVPRRTPNYFRVEWQVGMTLRDPIDSPQNWASVSSRGNFLSRQREASLASCYVRACCGCAGWLIVFPRNSRR